MLTKTHKILEAIPDLIFILNKQGIFLEFRGGNEGDLVYDPEYFLQKNISDLYPGNISKAFFDAIKMLEEDSQTSFEYQLQGEKLKTYETRLIDLDEDKVMAIIRDVTAQKRKIAEQTLHNHNISNILNELNEVLWSVSLPDYKKIYFSPSTEKLYEVPMEVWDMNPSLWMDMIHPEDKEMVTEYIEKSLQAYGSYQCAYRIVTASGKTKWINNKGSIINDEKGNGIRLDGIITDITEIKEQEIAYRNLTDLQALLMKMASEYINLKTDDLKASLENSLSEIGTFVSADRAYIFDYDWVANTCSNTYEWCAENIPPEIDNLQSVPLDFINDWVHNHRNGKPMYIDNVYDLPEDDGVRQIIEPQGIKSLITIPILDQKQCLGFIGFDSVQNFHKYSERERTLLFVFAEIYLNITKRIALEQKLIEEKENAKAASRAKSEFLANMSHEIRTPLNGVIGFTDLLLKTPLNPTQQQYAENANTSGKALLSIINDILDFSKIEAGKLELDVIKSDLVDLLEQATDILKFHAGQKNIELLLNIPLDMPRFARVDPIRLKQILINLLSNAVKFTEIGEVELRVTFEKLTDKRGRYKFSVRDTGIGISEDQQKKLFKAFTQADSTTTRKFGGTGLGLTISNLLATKMGGEIKLESTFNKGSIFYFTIETDYEFGEKYLEHDELEIESVLVIDDNENNRTILEHNFARWNVKFHGVEGGPQALELLEKANDFDLLIIDYHMPEMDGLETIRKIRDIFHTHPHRTPIMLLHSSSDDQSLREECKKLGVKFNLVKPVKAGELYQFLKNIHIEETVKAKKNPTPALLAEIKGPINILVAEDVKMNMLLTRTLLKRIVPNANVIEAYNGLEAVHATRAHAVDLVLMDVQMPELDGLEATYQIRELDKLTNRHLPVVALTAGAFKEERERCISSGMDDFLTKPIQVDELTRVLGKYLLNNKTLR